MTQSMLKTQPPMVTSSIQFTNMSKENISKKLIRSKSGLRIVAVDENHRSPFLLCEPQWMPDKEAPICTKCGVRFGFTTRRHHCRRCGQIYCSSCCDHKLGLPRMCFIDPVRICENCTPATLEENKFFDQQIKTLTNGATFVLETDQSIMSSSELLQCKLSPNHRHLMFDGVKLAPLDVNMIRALHVDKDHINDLFEDDDLGVKSVEIEYNIADGQERSSVKLATTPEVENRKTGASWITAMQQAVKLLHDYQTEG